MAEEETCSVVVERILPHPPQKVWRALTQGPLIEAWLMANDFEPVVGHRFNLRAEPNPHWNGVVDCEVLAVEPHQRLVYTWGAGIQTVVTFTLTPVEGGTRLRMVQSGFRPQEENNRRGAEFGWSKFIGSLEEVLAKIS